MRRPSLVMSYALLVGSMSGADAEALPAYFQGLWAYTSVGVQTCKAATHQITSLSTDDDGVMAVKGKVVSHLHWFCNVVSVTRKSPEFEGARAADPMTVGLACSGDGQDFKEKEIWSLHRVFGKEVMVVYNSRTSTVNALSKCE